MKYQINYRLFLLLGSLCWLGGLSGQPLDGFLQGSSNQKMILRAAEECVVVVRQEYTVRGASGQAYGRDGETYFNAVETAGLLSGKTLHLNSESFAPWQTDPDYLGFAGRDSLQPEATAVYYRTVADTAWHLLKVTAREEQAGTGTSLVLDHAFPVVATAPFSNSVSSLEDYWTVILVREDPASESYRAIAFRPAPAEGGLPRLKTLPLSESVLGGLVFLLQFSPGTITLRAEANVNEKDGDGYLESIVLAEQTPLVPATGSTGNSPALPTSPAPAAAPESGAGGLQPVGNGEVATEAEEPEEQDSRRRKKSRKKRKKKD